MAFFAGLIPRVLIFLLISLDLNWDFFTLKIGLSQGRVWDLNWCEYYEGAIPSLVSALLL
ncbi:MAG: hypothetical protein ACUVV4_04130 [Candidatus Bathyarchaeia archaeon]